MCKYWRKKRTHLYICARFWSQ